MIIIKCYQNTADYDQFEKYVQIIKYYDENTITHVQSPVLKDKVWSFNLYISSLHISCNFPIKNLKPLNAEDVCRKYFNVCLEALQRNSPGIIDV